MSESSSVKFKKYMLYAIGEIILVVIGILIAVSINNWKESINLKKVERNIYSDLKQELQTDLKEIQGNRRYNQKYLSRYNKANEIILNDHDKHQIDTLASIALDLIKFSDFQNDVSAYELLSASGKLDLLTNKDILKKLQNLSMTYNYINRLEKNQEVFMYNIVPKLSNIFRINPLKIMLPSQLYNYKFHNDIYFMIHIGSEKEEVYQQGERALNDLISALQDQLK